MGKQEAIIEMRKRGAAHLEKHSIMLRVIAGGCVLQPVGLSQLLPGLVIFPASHDKQDAWFATWTFSPSHDKIDACFATQSFSPITSRYRKTFRMMTRTLDAVHAAFDMK